LILLFGSAAFAEPVSFFFIPVIRAQNEDLREADLSLFAACSFETGGFKL
jgi:hypothetical protein